jgi:ABC-type transporter Mla maintaining outer membrane lipid asymmetry ATPase subunit MlaF
MAGSIIKLNDVAFSAQNMRIVRNVSLEFEEAKTSALVGPPGGGKSTVLKLAAGLLVPTGGKVWFRGRDISAMNRNQNLAFRKEMAFVFQDSALWANQNLHECLELPLRIRFPHMAKAERNSRIEEVLAEVGYRKDVYIRPSMLSMGEQKLIAFARAILCHPTILFLDEWTESLDDSAAQRLVRLVRNRQTNNLTNVFVSHDFRLVKSLADHIYLILGGQLYMKLTREQVAADEDFAQLVEKGIAS